MAEINPACCGTLYWCVDGIIVAAVPGPKPTGTVVLGPWATVEEAILAGCEFAPPPSSAPVPTEDLMGCTPFCASPKTPLLATITISGGHYNGQTFSGVWNWVASMTGSGYVPVGPGYNLFWGTGNTDSATTGFGLAIGLGVRCDGLRGGITMVFDRPPHDTTGHDGTDGSMTTSCIDADVFTIALRMGTQHDGTGVFATIVASVIP